MITFNQKGDWSKTTKFLDFLGLVTIDDILNKYGQKGVAALSGATPVKTGLAATSWLYKIVKEKGRITIEWHNTDIENGINVAVLIQYGHATKNGGFVQGIDYINPAMKPIFDEIANDVFKEVISQ